jgi:hypothetical protein
MKKMFKLFMCAAVITAGFTACSEDVTPIPTPPAGPTETGLLTITLQKPTTYATDANATVVESKINDVTILVFTPQGVCKVDTVVDMSSVTQASDNVYKVVNINVPLGDHDVYAGVNLTNGGANKMRAILGSTYGVKQFVNLGPVDVPTPAEIDSLYAPNKFPMFSADVKPVSIKATLPSGDVPDENKITIKLDRMVAKFTVHKNAAFTGDNLKAAGATFSQSLVAWDLGNLNAKIYPYGKAIVTKDDPNFDFGDPTDAAFPGILISNAGKEYRAKNFINYFNTTGAYASWTGFATVANESTTSSTPTTRNARYAPENNSLRKRKGESTFVVVRAKFAPDKVLEFKPGATTPTEVQPYQPDPAKEVPYFVVTGGGQIYYFATDADADQFKGILEAQGHTVTKTPYYGQYCFYRLFVGKDKDKSNVWRNYFYEVRLDKITGLGTPTGEIPDEEVDETGDNKGLLEVTIDVNPWIFVGDDFVLE